MLGKYRLGRRLGEGGMGMVFEAERADIGGRAAVKLLRTEWAQNPEMANRFFNEARAANLLEHPSIVRILDYGTHSDGRAYLAMEFLEGESLDARLKRIGPLACQDALRIGRQIALGLALAHQKKVVHRDLKPANIMLVPDTEVAGGERVKILDFGIAKLTQPDPARQVHTRTGMLIGTPIYMSPEQCRGAGLVDEKTDVYSLGVVLFELVAGQPPFWAEGSGEIIARHLFGEIPSLGLRVPEASADFCSLVHRMLAKEPTIRPSMTQVTQELGSQLEQLARASSLASSAPTVQWSQTPTVSSKPGARFGVVHLGFLVVLCVVATFGIWVWTRPKPQPIVPPQVVPNSPAPARAAAPAVLAAPQRTPQPAPAEISPEPAVPSSPTVAPPAAPAEAEVSNRPNSLPREKARPTSKTGPKADKASEVGKDSKVDKALDLPNRSQPPRSTAPPRPEPIKTLPKIETPTLRAGADPEAGLTEAQNAFVNGDLDKAISLARSVSKASPIRAWRIIGAAACRKKDLELVGDAFKKLDITAQQYLVYVCQREGIVQSGNRFELSGSRSLNPSPHPSPRTNRSTESFMSPI